MASSSKDKRPLTTIQENTNITVTLRSPHTVKLTKYTFDFLELVNSTPVEFNLEPSARSHHIAGPEPEVFTAFETWVKRGVVAINGFDARSVKSTPTEPSWDPSNSLSLGLRLWRLAEQWKIPRLQDAIINELHAYVRFSITGQAAPEQIIPVEDVYWLCGWTHAADGTGSKLRLFMTHAILAAVDVVAHMDWQHRLPTAMVHQLFMHSLQFPLPAPPLSVMQRIARWDEFHAEMFYVQ